MKRIILLLLLFAGLFAWGNPPSRAQGAGVLQGRIVNGTAGGGPVGGLEVELRTFQGQSASGGSIEGARLKTTADPQGQFRFEGLSDAEGNIYQAVASYQGVVYSSSALQFESGNKQIDAELSVYETTTDNGKIEVSRAHLLVNPIKTGLAVTELYLLMNSGDRTYVGQQQVQGRRWTSSYQLPTSARDVVFEDGDWGGRFLEIKGGLVDTEPLWPGQTTVIFAYSIDCSSSQCDLSRTLQQRISNLNLLVPDTGVTVTSTTLAAQGTMEAQGRTYLNFAASDLAPSTSVDLRVAVAGSVPASVPASAAGGASALPWIILGTVVSVVYLGYPFWRRRVQEQVLRNQKH